MAVTGHRQSASTENRIAIGLIVVGLVSILTLGTGFALLAVGVEFFWVVFPVGFGAVLPIALGAVALQTTTDD